MTPPGQQVCAVQVVAHTARESIRLRDVLGASAGQNGLAKVARSRTRRDLVLLRFPMLSRSRVENRRRSAPLVRNCRGSRPAFSFDPRCHGLLGSRKATSIPSWAASCWCPAISRPQPQVSDHCNAGPHSPRARSERSRDQAARLSLPPRAHSSSSCSLVNATRTLGACPTGAWIG